MNEHSNKYAWHVFSYLTASTVHKTPEEAIERMTKFNKIGDNAAVIIPIKLDDSDSDYPNGYRIIYPVNRSKCIKCNQIKPVCCTGPSRLTGINFLPVCKKCCDGILHSVGTRISINGATLYMDK